MTDRYSSNEIFEKAIMLFVPFVIISTVFSVLKTAGMKKAALPPPHEFVPPAATAEPLPTEEPWVSPFLKIYYAEEDNLERYEAYSALHPELSCEEVVWRVNSYLDYDFYTHDVPADTSSPYIIVNKYFRLSDDYVPQNLVTADGYLMTYETAEAYKQMRYDAAQAGYNFCVISAYRSVSFQRDIYNGYLVYDSQANVDRYSARAGYSEHHTGLAIDLIGSFGSLGDFIYTPESRWIYENAYKYGFIVRYWEDIEAFTGYEDEPWHLRYVGADVATDMHNKGIRCFEEYKVKYIDHRPE